MTSREAREGASKQLKIEDWTNEAWVLIPSSEKLFSRFD